MQWIRQVARIVRKRRFDRELEEELRFHVDQRRRALEHQGATPTIAEAEARRALGGALRVRETARDVWALAALDAFVRDLRYAIRTLRRAPSFTLAATITLALAIGANTAIFSFVEAVLLRPLPYANPDRLVVVEGGIGMPGAFATLRRDSTTIDYAAFESREANLTGLGVARRIRTAVVSAELFATLGVAPQLGRSFQAGEDAHGRARVALISDGFWRRTLGADPDVVGRHLVLDARPHEIVGVMPAGVVLPAADTAVWTPLDLDPADIGAFWGRGVLTIVGRLRPRATREAAEAELRAAMPRIRTMFPWRMPDAWGSSVALPFWRDALVGPVRLTFLVLLATAALVWIVACANVANLMLARGAARAHEIAVRGALGASRGQLLRQLGVESLVLASLGGIAGSLIGWAGVPILAASLPPETPRLAEVSINARLLAFGAAVTLVTALAFGLAPAWRAARANARDPGASDRTATAGRSRRRWADWLVAAQVATAVVLVVGANLLLQSLWRLSSVDVGFAADRVVTAQITPNVSACSNPSRCLAFYGDVLDRARTRAGAEEAAVISTLPLTGEIPGVAMAIEDHPRDPADPAFVLWQSAVSPDYFRVMGIPLLRGRSFTDADRDGSPQVAIINAAMARRLWPNADPIGRRLKPVSAREWRTIVGVVGDVTEHALAGPLAWIDGAAYVPWSQSAGRARAPWSMTLVARAASDAALVRDLPAIVASVSAEAPVTRVRPMAQVIGASIAGPRTVAWLLTLFAALALTLGAVGIAGVIAYTVAERTREIGIRLALGGRSTDILRATVGETVMRAGIGLAAGLTLALVLSRGMTTLLFATAPRDPVSLVTTVLLVSGVALLAALVPAHRALRVNPVEALRIE